MITSVMKVSLGDYQQWRDVYNTMNEVRESYGQTGHRVLQTLDNPNEVTIIADWEDGERAKAFFMSAELQAAMQRAGIQGAPTRWLASDVT